MWRIVRQPLAPLGSGASLFGAAVNMGCCAPAIVWSITASLSSVGLGFLVDAGATGSFFYGSLGLSGLGLTMTAIRSRSVVPVASGAMGISAILFAFSRGMDVWVFQTLVYGGLALLVLGSGWPLLRAAARKISHVSRTPPSPSLIPQWGERIKVRGTGVEAFGLRTSLEEDACGTASRHLHAARVKRLQRRERVPFSEGRRVPGKEHPGGPGSPGRTSATWLQGDARDSDRRGGGRGL